MISHAPSEAKLLSNYCSWYEGKSVTRAFWSRSGAEVPGANFPQSLRVGQGEARALQDSGEGAEMQAEVLSGSDIITRSLGQGSCGAGRHCSQDGVILLDQATTKLSIPFLQRPHFPIALKHQSPS
jgi:hypothetical protein